MASPSRLPSIRRPNGAGAGRSRPVSMIEPGLPGLDLYALDNVTSKSVKRKSLLPQFSRTSSSEYKNERDIEERENEGLAESRLDGADDNAEAGRSSSTADRKAMPPPSKAARPPSGRTAGVSQLGRAPSTRSHTRTQSKESSASSISSGSARAGPNTASNTISRVPPTDAALQRTSSTRLPQGPAKSSGLARSSSIRAPQTQVHSRTTSTTSTDTAATTRRSTAARPVSMIAPSSTGAPLSPTRHADPRASTRSQMPPPSRPAFSTFQQHYSPAKSALPKPPVPTSRHAKPAVTAEEDTTVTFEVAKQQVELLQLSLLHETSSKTLQQYLHSAHRKIGKNHAKLRKELSSILAAETEHQRAANLEMLHSWCPDPGYLVENLQTLARMHRDITALTDQGSRYNDVLNHFESWIASAEATMQGEASEFINTLPHHWREAHASVALKVRSLQREMGVLPPLPSGSSSGEEDTSLERLVRSCRTLIDGILRELDMMEKLEREILAREKSRIDIAVGAMRLDDPGVDEASKWVPAWQSTRG